MSTLKILKYIFKVNDTRIEHYIVRILICALIIFAWLLYTRRMGILVVITLYTLFKYNRTNRILWHILKFFRAYMGGYTTIDILKTTAQNISREFHLNTDFKFMPYETRTIILANYPSESIEYIAPFLLPINVRFVVIPELVNFMTRAGVQVSPIGNYNTLKEDIRVHGDDHYFAYINRPNTRLHNNDLGRLRTGLFHIAHELGIPIAFVYVGAIKHDMGAVTDQEFKIIISPSVQVANPAQSRIDAKRFFQKHMRIDRHLK